MGIFSQEDFDEILCEAVKRGRYDVVRLLLGSNIQFSLEIVKKLTNILTRRGLMEPLRIVLVTICNGISENLKKLEKTVYGPMK